MGAWAELMRCEDRFGRSHLLRQQVQQSFSLFVSCVPVAEVAPAGIRGQSVTRVQPPAPTRAAPAGPSFQIDPHRVSVVSVPPRASQAPRAVVPVYSGPARDPQTGLSGLHQRGMPYAPIVQSVARRHGLDPHYLMAMMRVESAFNPQAVSHAGAVGLMQIMPATGRRFGVNHPSQLTDPVTSVETAARYLTVLRRMFADDWYLITAAYNAGEGAVRRYGNQIPPFRETQNYVRKVESYLDYYRRTWPELATVSYGAGEDVALGVQVLSDREVR